MNKPTHGNGDEACEHEVHTWTNYTDGTFCSAQCVKCGAEVRPAIVPNTAIVNAIMDRDREALERIFTKRKWVSK